MTPFFSRRAFLRQAGMGFGAVALDHLLAREARAVGSNGTPHFPPRAKSVILLFMAGGVSQMESFDPKPALTRLAGKSIKETDWAGVLESPLVRETLNRGGGPRPAQTLFPLQVGFRKRGRSGIEVSDWWPEVGACVDDLAIVRSMYTGHDNHQAQYQFLTGRNIMEGSHPSLGAWVHYGLGSLNENLPQFIVLGQPLGYCCGDSRGHGADYLGPAHGGVRLETEGDAPLRYVRPARPAAPGRQEAQFELLHSLNRHAARMYPDDPDLDARIRSYELAFRMQAEVPKLMDFSDESPAIRRLYALDRLRGENATFARQCLLARRLVESGVRFVQIFHGAGTSGAWDGHDQLKQSYTRLSGLVDPPIAGLLRDLKQRGLLETTLVVFATEFGRTPGLDTDQGATNQRQGRDHHPFGFSVWLAGGGVKGGVVHGATDELGFHAVEDRHYVTDLHATILHQLGVDPRRLDPPGRKRIERDYGHPIRPILA